MKKMIIAAAFTLAGIGGAAAQDVICADFVAMDTPSKLDIIEGMATDSLVGQGTEAAMDNISRDDAATDDPKPADDVAGADTRPGGTDLDEQRVDLAMAVDETCAANPGYTVEQAIEAQ